MKIFDHAFLDFANYEATTTESGRVYHIGSEAYPSVTTFLGKTSDKSYLDRWRDRLRAEGKDPDKITQDAADRGEKLHAACEDYILNKAALPVEKITWKLFKQIQPQIDRLEKVFALEHVLYSRQLRLAGRVDCVGVIDGINTIVDFKTSTNIKFAAEVEDYKLQVTVYSMMMYSMFKLSCPRYRILIASEKGFPTVVQGNVKDHYSEVVKRLELFRGSI